MYDSKYDSKMHDITIPLMGFNGFHHAGNKDGFENFIGRESILDKLKSWLVESGQNYSGAYLITGFRGMGKSAFVHKAIKDIQGEANRDNNHFVPIPINMGNDMLTSKELLYIICKLLSSKFDEETRLFNPNSKKKWTGDVLGFAKLQKQGLLSRIYVIIGRILSFLLGIWLLRKGLNLNYLSENALSCLSSIIKTNTASVSDVIINYGNFECTILHFIYLILGTCFLLIAFFLIHRLYYRIWNLTGSKFFITTWQIKRIFRHLNERIDSEMTESNEYGIDSSKNAKPFDAVPGLRLLRNKKNVYPIAQTTEIQDLLVKQLGLINNLPNTNFRIIFIIDELDKVSPENYEKEIVPEYNSSNIINGNSTYHSRQKAFVGLLANMKYFISSSEAKFIFITGYDMYEATLADISNREFNLHSIFNGYINVSSFLRKTGDSKGADSLIEEYFCHLIMRPEDSEKRTDLRDYANFFQSQWEQNNPKIKRYELLLDRRITFLRHFLTYLFYMSNGSPKKLAIYLEKYVRSKTRIEEQYELKHKSNLEDEYDDLSLGVDPYWEDCDWFLYFDVRNTQKIEFINYLIYPMIKNLIAKSSTYNDKLLVATSFMISNLYKFHKSGFSWRNIEYMPELLDINKMPELRDFIGGILQFLNQTHIDEAVANLYKFKFPQRLSEEITFYSKTAEEVSYLFNFSHDELLSIKALYNSQLEHYSANKHYESPAIASLHQLLGDIYMLEENYEQAIFEFNEALDAIRRQERAVVKDFKDQKDAQNRDLYLDDTKIVRDSSKILFKIRVTLKLGLAYEKRKTFDTAYIVYENLTRMLLGFASKVTLVQKEKNLEKPLYFRPTILRHLDSNATLFSNIRLSYLCILAKVAVLEKMDLGGIRENDLWRQIQEFTLIENNVGDEMRRVVNMDFYTKLGVILFFKNITGKDVFVNKLREILQLTTQTDSNKFDDCRKCSMKYQRASYVSDTHPGDDCLTPCLACQYFNKSLKTCMEELEGNIASYERASKAIFFLQQFLDYKRFMMIHKKGDLFVMAMSNALLGMGNTLLGCGKVKEVDMSDYFKALQEICDELATGRKGTFSFDIIQEQDLSPFTKSFLYYLAAAESYKMLTDYKAAYNIYIQVLDAVAVYYQDIIKGAVSDSALKFCERITKNAIHCAYLHYDSINCAEVDTQKHELGRSYIDYINLHSLTDFPEIEVAIDKYYRIQLMGDKSKKDEALKSVLNSRQLGNYKLISTLTQGIQNLYLKVAVNQEILSRILSESKVKKLFGDLKLDCQQTIQWIVDYYNGNQDVEELEKSFDWDLFSKGGSPEEKRFVLLDYLLKDSLFCLNLIIEFIEPLYSTTLYNNAFVGDIYCKTFVWDHILIAVRELFEYVESEDKDASFKYFKGRYSSQKIELGRDVFDECARYFKRLQSWENYCPDGVSRVECIYYPIRG